jgi:predicted nucleotidyltransferase/DNA-binding transcriptional ArsR family regulator
MGMIIPDMGMIDYEKKLYSYLFNKTRRNLLALLFGRPDESFYVNQIVQRLGNGSGAVQRELKMMTEAGIVVREKKGNLVYYQANEKCPIFEELKSLVQKMDSERTEGITSGAPSNLPVKAPPDKLAEFCRKHHIIKLSFFGSVLRDDFRPDSDVDVLVEFEPEHVPGFAIIEMEAELSRLLKRKVDMRTPGDLSRYFRDRVVREARVEYAETKS